MIDTTGFTDSTKRAKTSSRNNASVSYMSVSNEGAGRSTLTMRLSEEATAKAFIHIGETVDVLHSPDFSTYVIKPGTSRKVSIQGKEVQVGVIALTIWYEDYIKLKGRERTVLKERWDLDQNENWVLVLEEVEA